MKQSDERVPGRGRLPRSFGRAEEKPAEDFTIRGGNAIHLVVHADVTPSAESLEALRVAVAAATRAGVLDGYAQALAEMDEPEQPLGGADGGVPPGGPDVQP